MVGAGSYGRSNCCHNGSYDGMMGPRFAKFQTLLERINAIAKENLRGVRVVKSFVREKISLLSLRRYQMNCGEKTFILAMPFLLFNL